MYISNATIIAIQCNTDDSLRITIIRKNREWKKTDKLQLHLKATRWLKVPFLAWDSVSSQKNFEVFLKDYAISIEDC